MLPGAGQAQIGVRGPAPRTRPSDGNRLRFPLGQVAKAWPAAYSKTSRRPAVEKPLCRVDHGLCGVEGLLGVVLVDSGGVFVGVLGAVCGVGAWRAGVRTPPSRRDR